MYSMYYGCCVVYFYMKCNILYIYNLLICRYNNKNSGERLDHVHYDCLRGTMRRYYHFRYFRKQNAMKIYYLMTMCSL